MIKTVSKIHCGTYVSPAGYDDGGQENNRSKYIYFWNGGHVMVQMLIKKQVQDWCKKFNFHKASKCELICTQMYLNVYFSSESV